MPASISEANLRNDDASDYGTKSETSLDGIYLVKNVSYTNSPIPERNNSLPWGSEIDLSCNTSIEASTPQTEGAQFPEAFAFSVKKLNNSFEDDQDIHGLLEFRGNTDKMILCTPDPAVFRAALRSFGSRSSVKPSMRREQNYHRRLMSLSSDSSGVLEFNDAERQFDMDESKSDVLNSGSAKSTMQSRKIENGLGSTKSVNSYEENLELTPKMNSYVKKRQLYNFGHARTPRPKRTLPRSKKISESIASCKMLDFSNISTYKKTRTSFDAEEIVCGRGITRTTSETICSAKNGISHRLSEKDYSRRESDATSDDYYASYLDYIEFSRAAISSSINDCPFESEYERFSEIGSSLETITEAELDGDSKLSNEPRFDEKNMVQRCGYSAEFGIDLKMLKLPRQGKIIPLIEVDFKGVIDRETLSGLAAFATEIYPIQRPMSIQPGVPLAKATFSIAKLTSTIGCKLLENAFIPVTVQAIIKSEITRAMGNGNSRAITGSKFLPTVGKKHTQSRTSKRRRYGTREVHKNVWRLEKRTAAGEPSKDFEMVDTFAKHACTIL